MCGRPSDTGSALHSVFVYDNDQNPMEVALDLSMFVGMLQQPLLQDLRAQDEVAD